MPQVMTYEVTEIDFQAHQTRSEGIHLPMLRVRSIALLLLIWLAACGGSEPTAAPASSSQTPGVLTVYRGAT
jgi:hypothetical protein